MNKAEVLKQMRAARAEWDAMLARIPEARMAESGVVGEWSVKDLLAHVMAYDRWTAAQLAAIKRGTPPTPRELYDLDEEPPAIEPPDIDKRNAQIYEHYCDVPLVEVRAAAQQWFDAFVSAVEALSDADLAAPHPLVGGQELWRLIPGQSYEHYRDHRPDLEAWAEGRGHS